LYNGAYPRECARNRAPAIWVLCGLLLQSLCFARVHAAEGAAALPAASLDNPRRPGATQTAVLAGGCFWGMQAVFEHVRGVRRVLAGYSGGSEASAHYAQVGTDRTDHAESIQVSFDPALLSYGELLRVYFSVAHDPTELNRQGPDEGQRYRSNIFYRDSSQQRIAQAYIAQLHFQPTDRHTRGCAHGVLPGGRLSAGFRGSQHRLRLCGGERPAAHCQPEAAVAAAVSRSSGAQCGIAIASSCSLTGS
jgi:methionine-S-sulfoxide reductase